MVQGVRFNWSCCVDIASLGWQGAAGWNLGRDVPVPTALISLLEQGHIHLWGANVFCKEFVQLCCPCPHCPAGDGTGRTQQSCVWEMGQRGGKISFSESKMKAWKDWKAKSKTETLMVQPCWLGDFHANVNQNFLCPWKSQRTGNKYWELTVLLLRKFFLFQGHFLNCTNLSNVPSVLQEVSFSAFV